MKRKEKTATKGRPSRTGRRGAAAQGGRYKVQRLSMVGSVPAEGRRRRTVRSWCGPAGGGEETAGGDWGRVRKEEEEGEMRRCGVEIERDGDVDR